MCSDSPPQSQLSPTFPVGVGFPSGDVGFWIIVEALLSYKTVYYIRLTEKLVQRKRLSRQQGVSQSPAKGWGRGLLGSRHRQRARGQRELPGLS